MKELTQQEEWAIQQFTGMHYSGGANVEAVCIGMGLEQAEWNNIKDECEWLDEYEIKDIEEYLQKRCATEEQSVEEIPQMKGTLEALNNLKI